MEHFFLLRDGRCSRHDRNYQNRNHGEQMDTQGIHSRDSIHETSGKAAANSSPVEIWPKFEEFYTA
jgi:hypothetical protein